MKHEFKIGDWVKSYSKGIYRIEKIVTNYFEECSIKTQGQEIGDEEQYRTIITKRFLNSTLKKSFSYESCSEFFIHNLTAEENKNLEEFILKNEKLYQEFENYQLPERKAVYNLELQIKDKETLERVKTIKDFTNSGKTYIEIRSKLEELNIDDLFPKNFGNYLVQFENINEEKSGKRNVWRNFKISKIK